MFKGLIVFLMLILMSCSQDKPTEADIDEELLDASISGHVMDINGEGINGIAITTSPGGYTSTSDFAGFYTIPKMERGTYSILFDGGVLFLDTILTGIEVVEDQDLINVDVVMLDSISDKLIEYIGDLIKRDIVGGFIGDSINMVKRVEVLALDSNGAQVPVGEALISEDGTQYSVTMNVPTSGGRLLVNVFDSLGHRIGNTSTFFDANDAQINVTDFNPTNGLPTISSSAPEVSIQDEMIVSVIINDPNSNVAPQWEIRWDGGQWTSTDSLSSTREAPVFSLPQTDSILNYEVRVIDEDSNIVVSSGSVSVLLDPPEPGIIGVNQVAINSPEDYTARVDQLFGSIIQYRWDIGEGWVVGDSVFSATWTTWGNQQIKVEVTDDDNNVVEDSLSIVVTNDAPSSSELVSQSVSKDQSVHFNVEISDANGILHVLWDFGHSSSGNPQRDTTYTQTESNVSHQYTDFGVFTVYMTVVDSFGNSTLDSAVITVLESFVDPRDGSQYLTTQIGTQVWMAENLRYLPQVDSSSDRTTASNYVDTISQHYYVANFTPSAPDEATQISNAKLTSEFQNMGVLYNWYAATQNQGPSGENSIPSGIQGICPTGWHLPSPGEWNQMFNYVKANSSYPTKPSLSLLESGTPPGGSSAENINEYGFNGRTDLVYLDAYSGDFDQKSFYHSSYKPAWMRSGTNGFDSKTVEISEGVLFVDNYPDESSSGGVDAGQYIRCVKD